MQGNGMTDEQAIAYLRRRRASYFFVDTGPALPAGASACWRLTPDDPHGWHSNMIGYVEAAPRQLDVVIETALGWFGSYHVDTWVDVDQFGPLFGRDDLLERRGFRRHDDWDALLCRSLSPWAEPDGLQILEIADERHLRVAARIAEQHDPNRDPQDTGTFERRLRRFRNEYAQGWSQFTLALLNDEPVGTARLTVEELPVVVGVVTVPSARGRGVATALTGCLVRNALAEHGACALYVERGSQAARIYRRLGFRSLFRCRVWLWRARDGG